MPKEAPKAVCKRSRPTWANPWSKTAICQRPRHVEERRQIRHWEGDTLIGKRHKHAIVSLVERKSGYAVLAKVEKKTADLVSAAIIKRLKPICNESRS